ncbi:MAG: extradiol dioxygenase [Alphaproteobacteria bacterium]|nr:extradiol dioxygenase [Alphaproteobacteria bacterium]MBV9371345.1 extradiol dioxygenase [Alphaproteobacteria bacterium]MBV9901809.1 extradiol dioxygenase [Alphaproteobacteria bacterium]
MITGAHVMIFTRDEAADRAFLRDVLEIPSIDSGGGWLIFKLPPAELGVHGGEANDVHKLYLVCDGLDAAMARLAEKGVACDPVTTASWGRATSVPLPGGGRIGLYEAHHARP